MGRFHERIYEKQNIGSFIFTFLQSRIKSCSRSSVALNPFWTNHSKRSSNFLLALPRVQPKRFSYVYISGIRRDLVSLPLFLRVLSISFFLSFYSFSSSLPRASVFAESLPCANRTCRNYRRGKRSPIFCFHFFTSLRVDDPLTIFVLWSFWQFLVSRSFFFTIYGNLKFLTVVIVCGKCCCDAEIGIGMFWEKGILVGTLFLQAFIPIFWSRL